MSSMKLIRVQYTIKPEFVENNKKNISAVMDEIKSIGDNDVKYIASQHEDGNTFMHVVIYKNEEAENLPASLDSFKESLWLDLELFVSPVRLNQQGCHPHLQHQNHLPQFQ